MRLVDARRLTGPTHLGRNPLVLVEIGYDDGDAEAAVVGAYVTELARMRTALQLAPEVAVRVRAHRGGVAIAYEAPIDTMLAAAEASEWAVESAIARAATGTGLSLSPRLEMIQEILERTRNPRLLALAAEARSHGLPLFWDDELVTIGAGARSVTHAMTALPDVMSVDWTALGTIPIALVTGTNGKTTSSRLLARMAREAGYRVALTSSDGVAVNGVSLEDGDWTGPGAARLVLQRKDVDLAVLETARGGILRRGLAVETCDVALITNVSDDHLGISGIDDVAAMAEVKAVIAHAVRPGGVAVLNANDPELVALAKRLSCEVVFFSDNDAQGLASRAAGLTARVIALAVSEGGRAVVAAGGNIHVVTAPVGFGEPLVGVDELPITFGGRARYNVENVLGATAAALGLGLPKDAIVRALRGFGMADNPGRGQVVVHRGVTVVLDFAHNAEGVRAVMSLVASLRGKGRLTVVTASPGDRTNDEIESVARLLFEAAPEQIFVRDLPDYLRGRAPGEVPSLFERTFRALGFPEASFARVESEVDALTRAFATARAGDVVAVLVHIEPQAVQAFLEGE